MCVNLQRVELTLNSKLWRWLFFQNDPCPATLLEVLQEKLAHIDAGSWPSRLALGGLYINGLPAQALNQTLSTPCKVEYFEPRYQPDRAHESVASFDPSQHIIYEDADIIAVFKPAGLPSLAIREQQLFNLHRQLVAYTGCKIHMPSRLDFSTSGVLAASKSEDTHKELQRAFERKTAEKFYLLEAVGKLDWSTRRVAAPIAKDPSHPVLRQTVTEGGKSAFTEFRALGALPPDSNSKGLPRMLIQARPLTGRTHQIRVHAASIGCPIVGDNFYNGLAANELRLMSQRLRLKHPRTQKLLEFKVPERLLPPWISAYQCAVASLL